FYTSSFNSILFMRRMDGISEEEQSKTVMYRGAKEKAPSFLLVFPGHSRPVKTPVTIHENHQHHRKRIGNEYARG
ncbi:hypothetical protein, partial [Geobacillus thermodenitrificans]|uniref:hypothetical protein n=1 Tax=Geobacillus thermodenitrificans TaxID=33940 RepID=UPI003D24F4B2